MGGEEFLGATLARGFASDTIEWPLVRSSTLFELRYGKALVETSRRPGRVPVFGTNGQCGTHDTALFKGPGVVCGRKGQGPLGVEWVDSDYWVIDTAYSLTPLRDDVDLKFAYYLVKYVGLNHLKDGTSNPSLSRDTFGAQLFPLPPLAEQRAIARILGALDDKIELNRKMNATLEAMARAVFKSWFVDFDPVRAKAEGRAPSGMDAETAKLFPSELVESELGMIPRGWTLRAVGDLAVLSGGKQLERALIFDDGTIPVFGGAGVMGFTAGHNADGFVISVGRVGAYCGQFFAHRGKAWINNNASLIRPKNEHIAEWMFIALKHADIEVIKKGAAQPFVSNGDIADLKLLWPGESTVAAFSSQLVPLLSAKDMNDAESKKLTRIRDELLPRLLSGKLSVTDAERAATEAL